MSAAAWAAPVWAITVDAEETRKDGLGTCAREVLALARLQVWMREGRYEMIVPALALAVALSQVRVRWRACVLVGGWVRVWVCRWDASCTPLGGRARRRSIAADSVTRFSAESELITGSFCHP